MKERFREKIAHGKEIEKNPSAFTDTESHATYSNTDTTLNQFNPHNPASFKKKHLETVVEQSPEVHGKLPEGIPPPTINILELKEMQLMAELQQLDHYRPQISHVERMVGVNTNYHHTKDFLNKDNPDYEIEQSFGYYDEYQVEKSVNNLNDLLLRKKHNQAIPFIKNYTPKRGEYQEHDDDDDDNDVEIDDHQPQGYRHHRIDEEVEDEQIDEEVRIEEPHQTNQDTNFDETDKNTTLPMKEASRSHRTGGGYRMRGKLRLALEDPEKIVQIQEDEGDVEFVSNKEGNMVVKGGVDLKKLFLD